MSPVFAEVGEALAGWGIPTAAAVASVVRVGGLSVIASGGIRDGVDAARALALGAEAVGVARPLLAAWKRGGRAAVEQALDALEQGLRAAMLLCGARDLAALRAAPRVLGPRLRAWLEALS
jgi:isopentenyl-diphosphate delta-isomerase